MLRRILCSGSSNLLQQRDGVRQGVIVSLGEVGQERDVVAHRPLGVHEGVQRVVQHLRKGNLLLRGQGHVAERKTCNVIAGLMSLHFRLNGG